MPQSLCTICGPLERRGFESAWKIQIYQSQQPNFPKRCRESITFPKKKDCPSDPLHLPIKNIFSGSKHVPHHWSRDDDFTSTVTWPWSQEIYELQSTTVKCDFFSQKKMASKSKTLPFPRDYRKEQNVNCHIHQSLTEWHKDPMINKNEKEENCKFKQILPSLGLNYPSRDNFWGRMHN